MRLRALCLVLVGGLLSPPLAAQAGRSSASLEELEARARADSNDAVAHYRLALGYWDKKRYDAAERALREAITIAPQYAEAYLALSVLHIARGEKYWKRRRTADPDATPDPELESARLYRRAFLLNPLVPLGILSRVDRRNHAQEWNLATTIWWYSAFSEGIDAFRDGRYGLAYDRLQSILRDKRAGPQGDRVPDEVRWYHGLSAAHLERYDQAIADIRLLLDRAVAAEAADSLGFLPLGSNDYRYVLATVSFLAGRYDDAVAYYREALAHDVGLYVAHVQLARIHERRQEWDLAIAERRRAIETNPDDPSLLLDLGGTLALARRWEEARQALRQAAEANRRDPRIPYLLGLVALQVGDTAEARGAFTRFRAMAPSRFRAQLAEVETRLQSLGGR
ncbi:MAG TPA: tetratricopeptide repeat protein [Gemmatimonadales bacterium]|nr:tetratricopeptide repeat protein [Gemmatimonadales bacterium]